MLVEHYADPNLLIPESNIAAIHYAAGMENTNFAEAAMKLILKHDGKDICGKSLKSCLYITYSICYTYCI